jgi:hypothetical protein
MTALVSISEDLCPKLPSLVPYLVQFITPFNLARGESAEDGDLQLSSPPSQLEHLQPQFSTPLSIPLS